MFNNAMWTGIVRGQCEINRFEFCELGEQIPCRSVQILSYVAWINTKCPRCIWHQLTKTIGSFWADSCWIVAAFSFDHRLKQNVPIGLAKTNSYKCAITLVTQSRSADQI